MRVQSVELGSLRARRRAGALVALLALAALTVGALLRGDEESLSEMCARPPTELTSAWQAECTTSGEVCAKPASQLTPAWHTECIARGHDPPGLDMTTTTPPPPPEDTTTLARLRLHDRDGSAGWAVIRTSAYEEREDTGNLSAELVLDVRLVTESAWERADIRSGTCDSITADRPYHTGNWRDPSLIDYSWSDLEHSRWVVEVYARTGDRLPTACGSHAGERPLRDDPPAAKGGGARRDGETVVVDLVTAEGDRSGTAQLTQSADGRFAVAIRHREFSGDAGLSDPPAHIRPGTCERPGRGREILLDVLEDDDIEAAWATSHTVVNGSLAELLATPHAIEIHGDFTGDSIYSCGTIAP